MPKQGTRAEVNTFVKGLITEASPLNFPANASFDEVNYELHRDGTRSRRLGMDLELGASFFLSGVSSAFGTFVTNTYIWERVGGDVNKEFLVVQSGGLLSFFDTSITPISAGYVNILTIPFDDHIRVSFTSVDGKLIAAGGSTFIEVISYDPATTSFTIENKTITVRDVWGREEASALEIDPSIQPAALTDAHSYNLQNQSWGIPRKNSTGTLEDPVDRYSTDLTHYPSNTETVWTGLQFQPVVGAAAPYERMYTDLYVDRLGASNTATKGYFIIDLLNRGTGRNQAVAANTAKYPLIPYVAAATADYNETGPTVVCQYAGRVFYAGFNGATLNGDKRSPNLTSMLFFSKLVTTPDNITQCYQEGDPTSRDSSEVVDTDGGFINILGATRINAMAVLGQRLVVLADNGVWALSGGQQGGFTATNYKIDKISSYGCISSGSVVNQGPSLMYWGKDAIYAVSPNQYGDLVVQDMTATTIQTLYNSISDIAKSSVSGVYDPSNKKVRWIYHDGALFSDGVMTQELVFDTTIGSFSKHNIQQVSPHNIEVVGIFTSTKTIDSVMYLMLHEIDSFNTKFSFGHYRNTEFTDWKSWNGVGVDAKAYLLTGSLTANDSGIDKQAPYLVVHMRKTDTGLDVDGFPLNTSSCLMRAQWEWSVNINSHKFGSLQEVYKPRKPLFSLDFSYDDGFSTSISKNKLRGKGKSISLYFESSPGKECHILGWSLTINGNANT